MKLRNLLTTLGLALTLGVSVGAGLAIQKGNDVKEAAATSYHVCGTFTGWEHTELTDADNDGVFSGDFVIPEGDQRFAITVDGAWGTAYRYDNLLVKCNTGYFWAVDWDYNNIGIKMADSGNTNVTICFRASDQAIMVFPQGSAPTAWKTIYVVNTTGSSGLYNDPRIHFWSDTKSFITVWDHAPTMTNENTTYTSVGQNRDSGDLYSFVVPSDTECVIFRDVGGSSETPYASVTEECGVCIGNNWSYAFHYMPNGYYIIGTYKGVTNWTYGMPVTGSDKIEDYGDNDGDGTPDKIYAELELSADDTFKIARYHTNSTEFDYIGSKTITCAESTYFPVDSPSSANIHVANAGIYYLDLDDAGDISGNNEYRTITARTPAWQFFDEFLAAMSCESGEPVWDEGKSWDDFKDWYTYTLDDYAKAAFATATVDADSDNEIEEGLARYFILVNRRGYTPFIMNSAGTAVRTYGSSAAIFMTIIGGNNAGTSATVVVIIATVALAAIGGYFFLRKRKED